MRKETTTTTTKKTEREPMYNLILRNVTKMFPILMHRPGFLEDR